MANRAEVNRLEGIDSRLIGPGEVQRLAPAMYVGPDTTYPIMAAVTAAPGESAAAPPELAILRLVISCPDRPGIVGRQRLLAESGANILSSAQYATGNGDGRFFLRMEFVLGGEIESLEARFAGTVAERSMSGPSYRLISPI